MSFACNARDKGVTEKVNGFRQDEVLGMDNRERRPDGAPGRGWRLGSG